jgi:hypothetical protein
LAIGISLGPYTAATKVTADIVAACLVLLVALLAWRAWPTRKDQMFWYPGGTAQLIGGENIALSDRPNGFLIPHLIKHSARQAGVPVRLVNQHGPPVMSCEARPSCVGIASVTIRAVNPLRRALRGPGRLPEDLRAALAAEEALVLEEGDPALSGRVEVRLRTAQASRVAELLDRFAEG